MDGYAPNWRIKMIILYSILIVGFLALTYLGHTSEKAMNNRYDKLKIGLKVPKQLTKIECKIIPKTTKDDIALARLLTGDIGYGGAPLIRTDDEIKAQLDSELITAMEKELNEN